MSINKFNSEGYYDPTAYEAMSVVEKEEKALRAFRPIVYICSPYAGDVEKMLPLLKVTAGLRWIKDIFPLRRICCSLSFSMTAIPKSVSWDCSSGMPL